MPSLTALLFIVGGALCIGLALGMLGSGGSAITLPVLVYLLGHGIDEAVAESTAIVGVIALVASVPYAIARQIHWRSVVYFGIPGMIGTGIGAKLGTISADVLQLLVFGFVLFVAAHAMLRPPRPSAGNKSSKNILDQEGPDECVHRSPFWKMALEGAIVGVVTGFVGVGGGFLIVPALVVLGRIPMRLAIGTSLVIIAIKSAVGLVTYQAELVEAGLSVDWLTIGIFAIIGVAASLLGRTLNAKMNQHLLRRVFAFFLIGLGLFVILREGTKLWKSESSSHSDRETAVLVCSLTLKEATSCRLILSEFVRPIDWQGDEGK